MVILQNITLSRGQENLLEKANLSIAPGKKVGLIGPNGSGKSTLFALLSGEIKEDQGEIEIPKRWVIQHVKQHVPYSDMSALDYVLAGHPEYAACQELLAKAQATQNGELLAKCHHDLEAMGGYGLVAQAAQLLYGLGFASDQHQQAVNAFSGGWRVRLHLARALLKPCDLLLLDEPTNHLDLDAMIWLERWLKHFSKTLIVIAHDAAFLNEVVDTIVHIEGKQLEVYQGDYHQFVRIRAEKIRLQQRLAENLTKQREKMLAFITRFRAKATKAKQVQSRMKAFNRLEEVAEIHTHSPYQVEIPSISDCPNPLIRCEKMAVGYDLQTIASKISLYIGPSTRIGLLGPNGAGKSTLIKTLAGMLPPVAGNLFFAKDINVGYFAQHQLEQLEINENALFHLQRIAPDVPEQRLRDFLGSYGFGGDKGLLPISQLSGGEQARLTLALIIWQKPHCLLLDEPTNHLDIEMREALGLALQTYQGAVVLISHDRELLNTTMDQFYLVAEGQAKEFNGDLAEYLQWLKNYQTLKSPSQQVENLSAKQDYRKHRSLQNKCQTLEKRMNQIYADLRLLENNLAQAYAESASQEKLNELLSLQATLQAELTQKEDEWMMIQETL